VNIVDFEGMAYDGTTVTPVISIAPGEAPAYMGSPKPSKRHILDPTGDWQTKANLLAGLKYAELANEFPNISFPCMGDYSVTDIVPREYFTLTLLAADTKRGIVWTAQRFIVQQMEERYDHEAGACAVSFTLAKSTLGTAGVTGDYPPTEPPDPPDNPPSPPTPPPAPGFGDWVKKVYVLTGSKGVFYTENFVTDVSSPVGVPTWTTVNTGLDLAKSGLGFRGDPFDPEGRQYCLMSDALYTRTGGNWTSILTRLECIAAIGAVNNANSHFGNNGLETNINQDGWVAVIFTGWVGVTSRKYIFISTNYGVDWDEYLIYAVGSRDELASLTVGAFQGDSVLDPGKALYCMGGSGGTNQRVFASLDGGLTWPYTKSLGVSSFETHVLVDPTDQDICYCGMTNGAGPYHIIKTIDNGENWSNYDDRADVTLGTAGFGWHCYDISITMEGVIRLGTAAGRQFFYKTVDDGFSWTKTAPAIGDDYLGLSIVQSAPNNLYILKNWYSGNAGTGWNVIWASINEGVTMIQKSGAHASTAGTGGGDSIPYDCDCIRGILQIWTA